MPSRATAPPPIKVGDGARRDVLLARASLVASRILYQMVQLPEQQREAYLRRALRPYGVGSFHRFRRERRSLVRSRNPNQATYDALRLVIGNHLAEQFLLKLKAASAMERDASVLGSIDMNDTERAVACGVTGGVTLLTGFIGSIYGGSGGGAAAAAGGGVAASTFGCNQAAQESAERIAAANAQAAQAQAEAALAVAQLQERAAQAEAEAKAEQAKQLTTVAIIGGGVLLLLATGYAILKV